MGSEGMPFHEIFKYVDTMVTFYAIRDQMQHTVTSVLLAL